jgi:ATP-dependent Lon protease
MPVLLDLLDAGTAKRFRDEYFEMEFDASRIIVVLTANDISKVPPPLLSRVEAFTVPAPQPGQRLRIIAQTMADLSEKTGRPITFAAGVGERLAERMDIDLRQLTRLVRASFATALQAGDKVARLKAPDAIGPVGFSLREWTPAKEQYRT